jgi:hypothetical protein
VTERRSLLGEDELEIEHVGVELDEPIEVLGHDCDVVHAGDHFGAPFEVVDVSNRSMTAATARGRLGPSTGRVRR